jgi:hypothetical protein
VDQNVVDIRAFLRQQGGVLGLAAKAPAPRKRISPMWLTSKSPTLVRTAMCSAISPPPGPGYSTGMSQPPKSTILAFNAR